MYWTSNECEQEYLFAVLFHSFSQKGKTKSRLEPTSPIKAQIIQDVRGVLYIMGFWFELKGFSVYYVWKHSMYCFKRYNLEASNSEQIFKTAFCLICACV